MSDRLVMERREFQGYCGVSERERETPQPMAVDLELFCDMRLAAATDDVAHTVDYTQVADRVLTIAQTERFHLLEALAERLAQAILAQFSVSAVELWVRSEEHTSELQSQSNLVCRLLLEKKKQIATN